MGEKSFYFVRNSPAEIVLNTNKEASNKNSKSQLVCSWKFKNVLEMNQTNRNLAGKKVRIAEVSYYRREFSGFWRKNCMLRLTYQSEKTVAACSFCESITHTKNLCASAFPHKLLYVATNWGIRKKRKIFLRDNVWNDWQ